MIDPVALALDLIRFDTISPPNREDACARHLATMLDAAGFDVGRHEFGPGRTSVVANLGGIEANSAPLAFTGHLDTVPLGNRHWSLDAFGEIRDGRLYGRGASDMKSGIACFVAAALEFAGCDLRRGIKLVLTAGEETGCRGARHLSAIGALGRAGALVVAEPTSNRLGIAHKGALHLRLRTAGATAHGSMPELGSNAVVKAARAISEIEQFRFSSSDYPLLGRPSATVTSVQGGEAPNVVPDACAFTVDIRTLPGQDHAELLRALAEALGPDVKLDEPLVDVAPVGTAPDDAFVQVVAEAMQDRGLQDAVPIGLPYFTDGSVLQPAFNTCPTVILGPGEPGQAHQTDEWCSVESIKIASSVYASIISRWCR